MPRCTVCGGDRPYQTEDFKMLREYAKSCGYFWYFCSWTCLRRWMDEKKLGFYIPSDKTGALIG